MLVRRLSLSGYAGIIWTITDLFIISLSNFSHLLCNYDWSVLRANLLISCSGYLKCKRMCLRTQDHDFRRSCLLVDARKSQRHSAELKGSLTKGIFQRCTLTASGLCVFLSKGFAQNRDRKSKYTYN